MLAARHGHQDGLYHKVDHEHRIFFVIEIRGGGACPLSPPLIPFSMLYAFFTCCTMLVVFEYVSRNSRFSQQ
jgi:hypothetical protein